MGVFAIFLMTISPRYFAEAMNNTKDIPFAALFAMSFYLIMIYIKNHPVIKWRLLVLMSISIGLCISTRVAGILLIPYLLLFLFIQYSLSNLIRKRSWKVSRDLAIYYLAAVFSGFIGFFMGSLFWPFALEDPISNPFIALGEMTKYAKGINMLYNGQHIVSTDTPLSYLPNWFFRTTPLVILLGYFSIFVLVWKRLKFQYTQFILFVLFASIFPVLYAMIKKSNLYDTLRHFLFIYPFIVIVSAYGWTILWERVFKWPTKFKSIAIVVWLILIIHPLRFLIVNHPNQVVYFNEITGGTKGNYTKYEMDYYMNSVKQACDWFIENEDVIDRQITVATTSPEQVSHYLKAYSNINVVYVRYNQRYDLMWDYGIFYNRFIDKGLLISKAFPLTNTIHTVVVDEVPLCIVVKQHDKQIHAFVNSINNNDLAKAKVNAKGLLDKYPKDELAYLNMVRFYILENKFDVAIEYANKGLELSPQNFMLLYHRAQAYFYSRKVDQAFIELQKLMRLKSDNAKAWFLMAKIQYTKMNFDDAQISINKAKEFIGNDKKLQMDIQNWVNRMSQGIGNSKLK